MSLTAWARDPHRRRWLVAAAWGLVLGQVAAVAVGVIAVTQTADLAFSNRLTEIGDILVAGTLTLAATAGLVAVQAYSAATGLPDLRLQIIFPGCETNHPIFSADIAYGDVAKVPRLRQAEGSIILHNLSSFTARNPVVVIRLNSMGIAENEYGNARDYWVPIEHGPLGIDAIQWDGGSDYSIHGQLKRVLPINLMSLAWERYSLGAPSMTIELLAEGYTRAAIQVPVYLTIPGEQPRSTGPQPPAWL